MATPPARCTRCGASQPSAQATRSAPSASRWTQPQATPVSPGSALVKAQAEAEGLDRIFIEAGLDWVEAGCSMCVGLNGDLVAPGKRCASTTNRNFARRMGAPGPVYLVSPAVAAASAVTGRLADPRRL